MDRFFGQRHHHSSDSYIRVNSHEIARNQAELETGCSKFFKRYIEAILEDGGLSSRCMEKKSLSLQPLLEEAISDSNLLQEANIESQIYAEDKLLIDPEQIKFVVTQVLENAVQYSNGLCSALLNLERAPNALVLSVKDKGIGIDPFEKEKIFRPFFRGLDSAKFSEGIGLGLTLSREILTYHDAQICIESQGRGQGSSVYISFPLEDKHIVYRDHESRSVHVPSAISCA